MYFFIHTHIHIYHAHRQHLCRPIRKVDNKWCRVTAILGSRCNTPLQKGLNIERRRIHFRLSHCSVPPRPKRHLRHASLL